jgi:hypothetical protein
MHNIWYKLFCRHESLQTGTNCWNAVRNYNFRARDMKRIVSVTFITSEWEDRVTIFFLTQFYTYLHCTRTELTFIFKNMENNFRAENRFRYYNYYFYIGGVPLFKPSVSNFYHVFILFCYICSYSTLIAMFMNIYHHIEDLDEVMYVAMLLILFSAESCTQLYLR